MITAGLVLFWPTSLMGATFSHLGQVARQHRIGLGRALACNTLGSAFAPLIFGVLLLPAIGAKWSFLLLSAGYAALAWRLHGRTPRTLLAVVGIILAISLFADLRIVVRAAGDKLIFYREGSSDSVAVLEHANGHRSLVVNNHFIMGGTASAMAERRHATIPLLLHPAPNRALFLGLGTGITFAAAAAHDSLRADGVELVPEIVEAMRAFAPHNDLPAADQRFKIFTADARRYARTCPGRYDVIVADLFHPARDGAGALYSLEHFRALRDRLEPDGLLCQWLPLYQLDTLVLRVIIRTFMEVFPDSQAFLLRVSLDTPVLGLIGRLAPRRYGPDYFSQRVTSPDLQRQLTAEQIRDAYHLFGCFISGSQSLRRFAQDAPLNTDDHPVVVFDAPLFNLDGREKPYGRLWPLLELGVPDLHELTSTGDAADQQFASRLAGFIAARNTYLKGFAADLEGRSDEAVSAYIDSARLSPFFLTGYAHCLTLAAQQAKSNPAAARALLQRLVAAQPARPAAAELLQRLNSDP